MSVEINQRTRPVTRPRDGAAVMSSTRPAPALSVAASVGRQLAVESLNGLEVKVDRYADLRPPFVQWDRARITALLEVTGYTHQKMAEICQVGPKTVERWTSVERKPRVWARRGLDQVLNGLSHDQLMRFCELTALSPIRNGNSMSDSELCRAELARLTVGIDELLRLLPALINHELFRNTSTGPHEVDQPAAAGEVRGLSAVEGGGVR